jgi:hypothetical protein
MTCQSRSSNSGNVIRLASHTLMRSNISLTDVGFLMLLDPLEFSGFTFFDIDRAGGISAKSTRTCISCAYMVRYWMGKMLAGSIERLLDNDRMDMVSDEFLRVGNKVPRFVLPGCGQDSTSSAYWMRETFGRSFASTGTEPCESITSSIAGALGLFAGRSLTSYTKERSLSCRGDCGSEE